MSQYLNARYQTLEVYTPGEQPQDQVYTKLNTNESPYPASPRVVAAIGKKELEDLRLYSDPDLKPLVAKLAEVYGLSPAQVFVSNGSDDILNFAFMAFSGQPGRAAFPDITYGFYQVFADLHQVTPTVIPLREDFSVDYRQYLNLDQMIVLANPNAQVGRALPLREMEEIIASNPDHVVVVDEAYVDFGAESCVPLIEKYPNLLVVQTFSKSRSLAGLRIGYAMGSPELISALHNVKYSFNSYTMNQPSILLGAASVEDDDYFRETTAKIIATREWFKDEMRKLGFTFPDSKANFLFAAHESVPAKEIFEAARAENIYVRYFPKERIDNYLRITIGTDEEMRKFVDFLKRYLHK